MDAIPFNSLGLKWYILYKKKCSFSNSDIIFYKRLTSPCLELGVDF